VHFLCGVFRSFTITGSTPYRQNFPVWCRVTCSFSTAVHLHWDSCVVFAFFENHTFVSETRYLVPSDTFYVVFSIPQVRLRLVATPQYRATLAGCSWASRVQARRHGVQLPAWSIASVPRGIVPASRRCRITATSLIRHPTAPSPTTPPSQLLWPTGFLCGWSISLEFPAWQLAESDYWREQ